MIDHVVVDVEIQKTIEETPDGWNATDKLGVAVACIWDCSTHRMRIAGKDDVEKLRERLLRADIISGYNIFNFDFPVIWGISKKEWAEGTHPVKAQLLPKTNDLLRRIWLSLHLDPDKFVPGTHGGWGLDAVASETIGVKKIGYGGDAPKWYQEGKLLKVANYCADDVAIERDLADFIEKWGYVVRGGKTLKITAPLGT